MNAQEYENELRKARKLLPRRPIASLQLEAKVAELLALLQHKADSKAAKKPRFPDNYSLKQIRRKKKRRRKSTGRRQTDVKRELVDCQVDIYPRAGVRKNCFFRVAVCLADHRRPGR